MTCPIGVCSAWVDGWPGSFFGLGGKVVYGGLNYAAACISYSTTQTKSGWDFLAFLAVLLRTFADRKIRLVCDSARFHSTKTVRVLLRRQAIVFVRKRADKADRHVVGTSAVSLL